jgi:DNA repair protein RadC
MIFSFFTPPMRPREKIQEHGVQTLTTPELISVIITSGGEKNPVAKLSAAIADKLYQTKKLGLYDLLEIKGIGVAKACQILAAIELVERLRPGGHPTVDSLKKTFTFVSEIRYADREHIVCLYLDGRMQLVLKETLAIGSVNQSAISPRDIFAVIKQLPVVYLILVHNHPSGNPLPSPQDLEFTKRIFDAGKILGVELADHIIVAKEQHYSWKEQHLL